MKAELSGWGRHPRAECRILRPRSEAEAAAMIADAPVIARGMGRAYGDAALQPAGVIDMTAMNRMLAFDAEAGVLTAEAGVTLEEIIEVFLPRGWFPSVTPGTKFVTLGGAIAADVHGKNHHGEGGFGRYVESLDLLTTDGPRRCSRDENAELFAHTIGGMGLTGVILRAMIRLRPVETGWIRQTTTAHPDLTSSLAAFDQADASTYAVAWIDCLARGRAMGRSLLTVGEHAAAADLPAGKTPYGIFRRRALTAPFDAPGFALNGLTMRLFNRLYYANGRARAGERLIDWDRFFYPLDAIRRWNRIYGRRGLAQFQCVIPDEAAAEGLAALLKETSQSGQGSFLAVLKRLGPAEGPFSFPMKGFTLALDFPVTRRSLALMERLDAIAADHGGRFYLAKDSRMSAATLRKSDPRAAGFTAFRGGAASRFRSLQSERLEL